MKPMNAVAVAACALCIALVPLHAQASGSAMGAGMAKGQDKMGKSDTTKMHEKSDTTKMHETKKPTRKPADTMAVKDAAKKPGPDHESGMMKPQMAGDSAMMSHSGMAMDSAKAAKKPRR